MEAPSCLHWGGAEIEHRRDRARVQLLHFGMVDVVQGEQEAAGGDMAAEKIGIARGRQGHGALAEPAQYILGRQLAGLGRGAHQGDDFRVGVAASEVQAPDRLASSSSRSPVSSPNSLLTASSIKLKTMPFTLPLKCRPECNST
ncbi:MAG: hypothetical protein V4633_07950 [Pseudomonadota bacterium]